MKSGLKPLRKDHRDYDFHKTFGTTPVAFPEEYSTDAELWNPNQDVGSDLFTPPVPPLPYGCTDYGTTDARIDEDNVLHNPMDMENYTHANARGGIDLREALKAALIVFKYKGYFEVRWAKPLDAFDSVRLAMLSTENEKRCVIVGSPYWLQFAAVGSDGILPVPDFNLSNATWHCWNVKGWKTINGVPYLVCKMWLGEEVGDKGFTYMSREIFNATVNVPGSGAFTLSKTVPESVQTVDMNIVDMIVSFMRNLLDINLKQTFGIGEYARNFGSTRSPEWPKVRAAHLLKEPKCAICGGTTKLTVHHIKPFHIDKSLELDPDNLITLCEGNKTINCHLRFGHFDNFRTKWNPSIRDEAVVWLKRFTAKDEQGVC